jgi:hypothetical protein
VRSFDMTNSESSCPLHDGDETLRGGYINVDSWVVLDRPHFDGLRMHPIWNQQEDVRRRSIEIPAADVAASSRQSVLQAQAQRKWVEKMASKRAGRRHRDSFWSGLDIML